MKTCAFLNCERPYYGKNYCKKHYLQWYNGRKIQERTWKDRNEYSTKGEMTYIFLYNVKQEKIAETVIDTEDFEKCKNGKWHLDDHGYVRGYVKTLVYDCYSLPYYLLGKEKTKGMVIDHINSDPLDNRKSNLQWITNQQNLIKTSHNPNNTSGYRGVCWDKVHNFWVADITFNGNKIRIGYFRSKKEAAIAYNNKAVELFGKFAVLNSIEKQTIKIDL